MQARLVATSIAPIMRLPGFPIGFGALPPTGTDAVAAVPTFTVAFAFLADPGVAAGRTVVLKQAEEIPLFSLTFAHPAYAGALAE